MKKIIAVLAFYIGFNAGVPMGGTNYADGVGFSDPYYPPQSGLYVGPYRSYAGPNIWYGW